MSPMKSRHPPAQTQIFVARAFQPALGPYGRHLSRFAPARIVWQGLDLLKLTEVTCRLIPWSEFPSHGAPRSHNPPRMCHYLRYACGNTLLGGTVAPVSPSSQTAIYADSAPHL